MELSKYIQTVSPSILSPKQVPENPYDSSHLAFEIGRVCKSVYETRIGDRVWNDTMSLADPEREWIYPAQFMNSAIIPASLESYGKLDDLVHWTFLYFDTAIFVMPVELGIYSLSYSGPYAPYCVDVSVLKSLVDFNIRYSSLVKNGRMVGLPAVYSNTLEHGWGCEMTRCEAPLIQASDQFLYLPVNHPASIQLRRLYQDYVAYKTILLPYFPGLSVENLVKIAKNETQAFIRFSKILADNMKEMSEASSESKLLDVFREIDYHVAELGIEAKRLSRLKILSGVETALLGIDLCAILFFDNELVRQVAGIAGSMNIYELIKSIVGCQREELSMHKNDFYLPYLIKRTRKS